MDKILTFSTHDNLGRCFAEAIDISPKRGAGIEKVAGELDPEIQKFLRTLKPDPRYQYVLMTPMGAYEYWGMNVNGDIFPEISLSHCHRDSDPQPVIEELVEKYLKPFGKSLPLAPVKDFGFRTFENALRYKHHVNKNPDIAYGDIVFVTYNKRMHRVELISRHDREKAKRVGAEEIIRDLDEGKPRQISMGCRVPFDVCTICGHVSRSPRDYCTHLRNEMGSIRDDGRVVGAINFFPRFFDLSDVFVPAAKESGVLLKVASVNKEASYKTAASVKKAELNKKILPNAISESIMKMKDCDPDIPKEELKRHPIDKLLTTLGMLGIVMKPREFQYGMLNSMGRHAMAEKLHRDKVIFDSNHPVTGNYSMDHKQYSPSIARLMSRIVPERSFFRPHLPSRIIKITIIKKVPTEKEHVQSGPILTKIAEAYSNYRNSLKTIPNSIDKVVNNDIKYYSNIFFKDILEDSLTKTASFHKINTKGLVYSCMFNAYRDSIEITPKTWRTDISSNSIAHNLFGQ